MNWPTCLLLHYDISCPNIRACDKIADFDLHQITVAELAVDRKIDMRQVSKAMFAIKMKLARPNLFWVSGRFVPTVSPAFDQNAACICTPI